MNSILLLSSDEVMNGRVREILPGTDLRVFQARNNVIDSIYGSPPELLIIGSDPLLRGIVPTLREDPIFSHLPILVVLDAAEGVDDWHRLQVDDYVRLPFDPLEFKQRVSLAVYRARRVVETNPLTMLPGNTPIMKEVQRRLDEKEDFALAYADLDYFKPYNDIYGFSRGDEIIRVTARLITNIVKMNDPDICFVGHIGGDDFVFITRIAKVEAIGREITAHFDELIKTFYDPEDRERGYIVSADRSGVTTRFPILSVSIGIAVNRGWFRHYGEISSAATEMKKHAKGADGSVCRMDRRDHGQREPSEA